MRRFLYVLPVAVFAVLALFFLKGLTLNPRDIPSVLIDRPVPEMSLAPLPGRGGWRYRRFSGCITSRTAPPLEISKVALVAV